jgi:hypothetical protein
MKVHPKRIHYHLYHPNTQLARYIHEKNNLLQDGVCLMQSWSYLVEMDTETRATVARWVVSICVVSRTAPHDAYSAPGTRNRAGDRDLAPAHAGDKANRYTPLERCHARDDSAVIILARGRGPPRRRGAPRHVGMSRRSRAAGSTARVPPRRSAFLR